MNAGELDQVQVPPPEIGQVDLPLAEGEWRTAHALASLLFTMGHLDHVEGAPYGSRQRAQAHAALNRWETVKPFLARLDRVGAASVARGHAVLKRFPFSPAARELLVTALARAPREPGEPDMPRPRTLRALLSMLGYVAAAYLDKKVLCASHASLAELVTDWTERTGERWLPILHRAAIIDAFDDFDEHAAPRKSKRGQDYKRSQAPKLYVVDPTLLLSAAIRITLGGRSAVGADSAAAFLKTAVANPSEIPSSVSLRGSTSEGGGLANAGGTASPSNRAGVGAPPASGGGNDPGRPRAALTAAVTSAPAVPSPASQPPTTTPGYEGKGSRAPLEVLAIGEQRPIQHDANLWAYGQDVRSDQLRERAEVKPADPPPEWRQLLMELASEEQARARGPAGGLDERWRRDVRSLLLARGIEIPDEAAPLVDERMAALCREGRLPDDAVAEILELLVRRRPRRPQRAAEEAAPPPPALPAPVATGPPMNAN